MTVINLELSVAQLDKFKSTDTVSEVCMNLCGNILKYLSKIVLRGNPIMSNRVDTVRTMLVWNMGILARACKEDIRYKGPPRINQLYVEKCEKGKSSVTRHAFDLETLDRVPVYLLVELIHKIVTDSILCIAPYIVTMTPHKVECWSIKMSELLEDLFEALDLKTTGISLNSVMIRIVLPDGRTLVQDFI